jgi:hypothetical protein
MNHYTPGTGLPPALPLGSKQNRASSLVRAEFRALRGTNTPATPSPELTPARRRRRVDADVLARIAELMPERDWSVLHRIAEHRYLTTHQVQAFVFTALSTPESAARTTRHVLQRLARNALIRVTQQRVGGARSGSAARVWQLAPAGARLIQDDGATKRTHEPSLRFLAHCLAIADVHLGALDLNKLANVIEVHVQTEPTSWRRYVGMGGEPRWLQPDLAVVINLTDFSDRWFVEVDLGTESIPTLLKKCGQYEAYRVSGIEQQEHGAFPLVLWMMNQPERAEKLRSAILRSPRLTPELYRFATADTVQAALREPLP